jgi:hypothetical protein
MATDPTYLVVADDGQQYGPISETDLRTWIREQRVQGHNQALLEGSPEWKPLADHPAFRGLFPPPPPPQPRLGAAKQSVWTKPLGVSPGEAIAEDLARNSKHPKLMRYVWQITIAVVVGVGILLSRMNWTSTASLETQVRKSIEETFRKNPDTRSTSILSFHLVHEGGNRYKGMLEAMTALKTETVEVAVTYDGRSFEWKIIPAANSPAPAVADEPPEPRPVSVARQPVRDADTPLKTQRAEFDTTDKSFLENGNLAVAVQKLQAGAAKTVEKTSIEDVTKNPYTALGKVCQFTGQAYKVEALPPNLDMQGTWTDILILVPNENSPYGATTVEYMCKGDATSVNAGDQITFSGYFLGVGESQNAMGGKVEQLMLAGDSLRTASTAQPVPRSR